MQRLHAQTANLVVDGLLEQRRAQGLPALSLQFLGRHRILDMCLQLSGCRLICCFSAVIVLLVAFSSCSRRELEQQTEGEPASMG